MQFAGMTPIWIAPLATGHPLGLPGAPKQNAPQKVVPLSQSRDPEAALTRGRPPGQFWRAVLGAPDPQTHAPPSIMQIKISQILDEQANEQAREEEEPQEECDAEPPAVEPATEPATRIHADSAALERHETTAPPMDPARAGYEEASSISRSAVLSTLP